MKLPTLLAKGLALSLLVATASFGFTEGTDYVKLEKPIANADKTLIKVLMMFTLLDAPAVSTVWSQYQAFNSPLTLPFLNASASVSAALTLPESPISIAVAKLSLENCI